jgi:Domain of unknown function (DUF4258)
LEDFTEITILEALKNNRFILTFHAMKARMPQRNVRRADIIECAKTAKKCLHDYKRNTFKVVGLDLDGDELNVVVGFDRDIIIITVF